jgi:hypothetical protein
MRFYLVPIVLSLLPVVASRLLRDLSVLASFLFVFLKPGGIGDAT